MAVYDNIADQFHKRVITPYYKHMWFFSKDTYKWAFQTAGFKEVYWRDPQVSPEGIQEFGEEFWKDALDYPRNWFIECVK